MPTKLTEWLKAAYRCFTAKHVVLTRQSIIDDTINILLQLSGTDKLNTITFWAADAIVEQTLRDPETQKELRREFDNAGFYGLGQGAINIRQGRPADNQAYTTVHPDSLYITFAQPPLANSSGPSAISAPSAAPTLTLTILDDSGSMVQPSYTLNPTTKQRFCIGRGQTSRRQNTYRINDVIIRTDDPNEDMQRRNNCVSSCHADVIFRDGDFFLQVQPGGCRNTGGSATKVIRNQQATEMLDTNTLYRLHNDDILDLGRQVFLRVSIDYPKST